MMICPGCGTQLNGSPAFCPYCGRTFAQRGQNGNMALGQAYGQQFPAPGGGYPPAPYSPVAVPGYYMPMNARGAELRQREMSEMQRMIDYFGQAQQEYDDYDTSLLELARVSRIRRPGLMAWGIILMVFGLVSLSFGSNPDSRVSAFAFALTFLIPGSVLFALFFITKSSRARDVERLSLRVSELEASLLAYYNGYGYCAVGAEYSNPRILYHIYDIMRSGRAETIKEAVNIMLDDAHKNRMERAAFATAEAARSAAASSAAAARGATVGAVFSAASFFLR